jgi:hypothetical protein
MGSLIRYLAIAISVVIVLGFALFAVNEAGKGSQTQQDKVEREMGHQPNDTIAPSARDEAYREAHQGKFHETIDDINDVLLRPFVDLVDSDSAWVNHGIPALLGLLIYGFGLGMLANALPKQRQHGGDWRTAGS